MFPVVCVQTCLLLFLSEQVAVVVVLGWVFAVFLLFVCFAMMRVCCGVRACV